MAGLRRGLGELLLGAALIGALFVSSCAKQGEGERCSVLNGSDDCESHLVCVESNDLADKGIGDRCCPPEPEVSNDSRCIKETTIGSGGTGGTDAGTDGAAGASGAAGSAGAGGSAGSGGSDAGPDAQGCTYSSECPGDLVCGPTGVCQPECVGPKDCPLGQSCVSGKCTAPADASAG